MATYMGNPSLSNAVKDRVVNTFQQTLSLYKQGRREEVVAGCNLMLQMDPLFDPAKKLLEKTRNPASPIDVDALLPTASADDAMREAHTAMQQRDFPRVIQITTEILTNDLMNDDARILADEAREKIEASPFVEQFLARCQQSLQANDFTAAKAALEKARALDPGHPAISRMQTLIAAKTITGGTPSAPAPPPPAPAPPPAAPPQSFNFDAGTSFVVDTPPPATPGRGTAQAADFGFTFEEDKPKEPEPPAFGGFSFDAPTPAAPPQPPPQPPPAAPPSGGLPRGGGFSFDAPATDAPFSGFSFDSPSPAPTPAAGGFNFDAPGKTPVSGDFDFSAASMETSAEDQKKIAGYMADGDRAFDSADYQKAIDLWSRIFLIDVTNEAASERIERAKQKRRDVEQKNEAILAAAISSFDRGDHEAARERLAEVLRGDPGNVTAQDYMDRMTEAAEGGAGAVEMPYTAPPAEKYDVFADEMRAGGEQSLRPPDPGQEGDEAEAARPAGKARKTSGVIKQKKVSKPLPIGAILTVIGILVLGGAGYFAWTKFSKKPEIDSAATAATIQRAQSLSNTGKYDQAIALLQDVKPDDPQHDKALLMISDIQRKKAQSSEMVDGRPAALVYQEGLANGKAQYEAHDYDGAKKAFESSMRVKPLPPDMKGLYDAAAQQMAKLDSAKSLFAERRYSDAIGSLQPLATADPQNKNIQRMLQDAHFNLGAVALQGENLKEAITQFDEVLKIDPADDLAKRSKELALRYDSTQKDLLYKIYVKYLPMRQPS
jgi:tetratricopeptide (TPR) repeat protein